MSSHDAQPDAKQSPSNSQPKPGEFPFPILDSNQESNLLTWLRNHSSYLTASGFLGNLSAIGVYIRGTVANLITLLPILIVLGAIVGLLHFTLLKYPLVITSILLAISALLIVGYFGARIGFPNEQSRPKIRIFENLYGYLVLALGISLVLETSPWFLEYYRHYVSWDQFSFSGSISILMGIAAIAGSIIKFLSTVGGARLLIASVFLAILGFASLWMVVLAIDYYVAFGIPAYDQQFFLPIILLGILVIPFIVAVFTHYFHRSIIPAILAVLVFLILFNYVYKYEPWLSTKLKKESEYASEVIGDLTRPVARLINGLHDIKQQFPELESDAVTGLIESKLALDRVGDLYPSDKLEPNYYSGAQRLLDQTERLAAQAPVTVQTLKQRLASVAFDRIIQEHKQLKEGLRDETLRRAVRAKLQAVMEQGKNHDQMLELEQSSLDEELEDLITVAELQRLLQQQRVPASTQLNLVTWNGSPSQNAGLPFNIDAPDSSLSGGRLFENIPGASEIVNLRRQAAVSILTRKSLLPHDELLSRLDKFGIPMESALVDSMMRLQSIEQLNSLINAAINDEKAFDQKGVLKDALSLAKPKEDLQPITIPDSIAPSVAKQVLVELALSRKHPFEKSALHVLGELYDPHSPHPDTLDGDKPAQQALALAIYQRPSGLDFGDELLSNLMAARFIESEKSSADNLLRRMVYGKLGNFDSLNGICSELSQRTINSRLILLTSVWVCALLFSLFFINPNVTSAHGFYRDRLAQAFLLNVDQASVVNPEQGVLLSELCDYENGGSTAPYHLINTALNLQSSSNQSIRDRNADFLFFSPLYVGGPYTGYIRTEQLQTVAPDLTAASAMAISAGAASPNMGKYTPGLVVFLMAIMNARLGYWIPNPKRLKNLPNPDQSKKVYTDEFSQVFGEELMKIEARRKNVGDNREFASPNHPSVENHLLGIALSGGGIRSASVNLGILQILDKCGIFKCADYLSTVSGGGYLGTSISVFMRNQISPLNSKESKEIKRHPNYPGGCFNLGNWRPKFWLFYREMTSRLNEDSPWINVSDGGHIENLGVYELLRRRCEIIIVGDGEGDGMGAFPGLSCLVRLANIDLGIRIEFQNGDLEKLLPLDRDGNLKSCDDIAYYAVAKIHYPSTDNLSAETGYMLYMRSNVGCIQDPVVRSYQKVEPAFPHQTTADQSFDEVQFEAYRRLGEQIARRTIMEIWGTDAGKLPSRSNDCELHVQSTEQALAGIKAKLVSH